MIKEGSLDEVQLGGPFRDTEGMGSDMWSEGQAEARAPVSMALRTSRE